jgi:hypothetical protein
MRFKSLVVAAASLSVLAACDQPTSPVTPAPSVEQRAAPTSAVDPTTGEAVALNYQPDGNSITVPFGGGLQSVYEPIEPCTVDNPCEPPCDTTDPNSGCYVPPCTPLISGFTTYRAGIQPYGSLEVSGTTSSSCGFLVLTGIGARVNGSDDYTTLHLRGRRIRADGSFGETVTYRFGSSPNHSLEAWGEVPTSATDFYGIVGIGIGQSGTEDVRTLRISYRKLELTAAGVRAVGPTYTSYFGANIYGSVDAQFITSADNEVFVGAGFRAIDSGERTATMAAHIGTLP